MAAGTPLRGARAFHVKIPIMAPTTHLLISWLCSASVLKERRERVLVALSGIAPDIDGLGYVIDKIYESNGRFSSYYFDYHHYVGHNVFFSIILSFMMAFFAKTQKLAVFLLSQICFYLHILCDLIGSRGPDGYQWPIYILYPINTEFGLVWEGQWVLSAWQNKAISATVVLLCILMAVLKKVTILEIFSIRLDREVFAMYKRYFGKKF